MGSTISATRIREAVTPPAHPPTSQRLISLDIFRGMTIAGMILVNNAGNWEAVWWPLDHARWNGWTPTDLIFPFFLFIVGVSMALSFDVRRQRGATRAQLLRHAVQRSAIIFLIGFALALWGRNFDLHRVRIYGVLPRIAAVYLLASGIVLYCGRRMRVAIAAALLVGYWLLLTRVPGFDLTMDGNLAGFVDRKLLYEHLWIKHRFDPEGLLSTLPAIVTTLMGVFTGEALRARRQALEEQRSHVLHGMVIAGAACMIAGDIWGRWFPINKNLWSSSYVLFTGGLALALLALCYWMVEVRGWRRWGAPFVWYGSNAIVVFAASTAVALFSIKYHARPGLTYKAWTYAKLAAAVQPEMLSSALYGCAYVLTFLVLAWVMYRKKIFVKI